VTLFLFALALGGVLLGLVAFGVVDHDFTEGDGLLALNLRGIAYGSVVFGGAGAGLTALGFPAVIVWGASVSLGIATMLLVTALFAWLRRSESGQPPGDGAWFGVEGTLVVPFDRATRMGRVSAVVGGQLQELTPTWTQDEPLPDLPPGTPVLIERLDRGIAILSSDLPN